MNEKPEEADWKKFRSMAPILRERNLEKTKAELLVALQDGESTATEKFWAVEERAEKEARILRACLDGRSRSKMRLFMALMCRHGMLGDRELESFDHELRDSIRESGELL